MKLQHFQEKLYKLKKPALYFVLAAVLQLCSLSYINYLLAEDNQPLVNEKQLTQLVEGELRLAESLAEPGLMSISPDKTLLALRDTDQLKVYSLKDGQLQTLRVLPPTQHLLALQWLPDRNRLIYAITHEGAVPLEPGTNLGPEDTREDPHSSEPLNEYRPTNQGPTTAGFQIALYSLDFTNQQSSAQTSVQSNIQTSVQTSDELILTLNQKGKAPQELSLYFSTYTNLLYVHWIQEQEPNDNLAVVDNMKRIKDIRLPAGQLTKLTVMPKTGELWSETAPHNGYSIYSYQKGRWHHHKELVGYRLLGVGENDQPVLGLDQQDWVSEIAVLDQQGNLEPAWAFQQPVKLDQIRILDNGSLLRIDSANQKTGVYQPKNKGATVYPTAEVSALANDGKMLISWRQVAGVLKLYQDVQE